MHFRLSIRRMWLYYFPIAASLFCASTLSARVLADINYGVSGRHDQQLDLFLPDSGQHYPAILFIHGGSLTSEDRKDVPYPGIGQSFASCGVACAVLSYRLGPENKWPAQPNDCAGAFAWIKSRGAEYGIDTSQVYIVGHSSGAFLAAILATDSSYLHAVQYALHDISGAVIMGSLLNDHIDTAKVPDSIIKKAFVTDEYFSVFGSFAVYDKACPVRLLSDQVPPMLILAADSERFQPPIEASAFEFMDSAKAHGAKVSYEVLPHRRHITTITKMVEPGDPTTKRILEFMLENKKQSRRQQ